MSEPRKAGEWREKMGLTRKALGDAIGYSPIAIYWFERGETPPYRNAKSGSVSRKIKPWVWTRYKRACAGVDAEVKTRKKFDW